MKTRHIIPLALIPLLFACAPKKPEVPLAAVPAEPLMRALEQRRESFTSLKAAATARIIRKGRSLALDNVGILIKSPDKLRIEAYSPLGPPMAELIWDGNDALLRQFGSVSRRNPSAALERVFGAEVDPHEFTAVLAGNVPGLSASSDVQARCGETACQLEFRQDVALRRVTVERQASDTAGIRPLSYELYRADVLVFRARFEDGEMVSGYYLPRTVTIENPDRKAGVTLRYEDVEVNAPVDDNAFSLTNQEGPGP